MADPVEFGRYLLDDRIAIGGMAEVHLARSVGPMGFSKRVVIKRILPQYSDNPEFVRMFVTEAKLVGHLAHPNIVQVQELGQVDGQYYMALEHVDGLDLRQVWSVLAAAGQRLPTPLSLFITSEFLKGLDYAHRAQGPDGQPLGVIHRDVSPSNILLSWRGDVKIADFGIALVQTEARGAAKRFKGKHEFMSPEQLQGGKIDHRSDVFSAGVILAELLLGRRLFAGKTELERLERVAQADISVFERHATTFPQAIADTVHQALQRDPARRQQSARDFRLTLAVCLAEQEHPIDSEMIDAFMSRYIAPRLPEAPPAPIDSPDAPQSSRVMSPVLPRGIVPDDAELTPPPLDELDLDSGHKPD